jgi:hypothetical protein
LFQTVVVMGITRPKAVLEQPSSRRMALSTLGRRNIALLQSSELTGQRERDEPTARGNGAQARKALLRA